MKRTYLRIAGLGILSISTVAALFACSSSSSSPSSLASDSGLNGGKVTGTGDSGTQSQNDIDGGNGGTTGVGSFTLTGSLTGSGPAGSCIGATLPDAMDSGTPQSQIAVTCAVDVSDTETFNVNTVFGLLTQYPPAPGSYTIAMTNEGDNNLTVGETDGGVYSTPADVDGGSASVIDLTITKVNGGIGSNVPNQILNGSLTATFAINGGTSTLTATF